MFRHSSLTFNADHMTQAALNKQARWSQNSRQNVRYIKAKIGQDTRNKILETAGIKVPDNKKSQPAVHQCSNPDCNYVNAYESEICSKCSTPLTPMAFEKIRQQQESKINVLVGQKVGELIGKSNLERDNTIQLLQQELKSYDERMSKMQKDLQDIKEFERRELREGREIFNKGMKEFGKNPPVMSVSYLTSPEMIEELKEYPRVKREAIFEEMIASVKDDQGYDETHPEIKKARDYYKVHF